MKKKYTVEFTFLDGSIESVEFVTENITWSVEQWMRNRSVLKHEILEESIASSGNKQMLLG